MIELRLLGSLDLRGPDGRPLNSLLTQPKRIALLAYLCVATPRGFHRRDKLLGLFWPESDNEHARAALRSAIHVLRRSVGQKTIVARGDEEVGVDFGRLGCDVERFDDAATGERVEEALEVYRGDLMEGFFLSELPEFEQWLEGERSRLRAHAARAARLAAERHDALRNVTTAVGLARRAVELAVDDERTLRALIELLDRLGDRAGAVRAYEVFAERLATEYAAEPSAETRTLIARVRARDVASPRAHAPEQVDRATPSALVIPGYEIERDLARGGMATVYLARDLKHGRSVAVKVMRPEIAAALGGDGFLREIQVTAQLAHPNILPLLDSGSVNGMPFYVMPFLAGESLRGRLGREGRLETVEAVRLVGEVADALQYAHRRGIVHCDIKPENILLVEGHAIVADFGVARALAAHSGDQRNATQPAIVLGSRAYMSPEQLGGSGVDARSDVYSLGCVLYELLAGEPVQAHGEHARKQLREHRPDVSAHVLAAVEQALARSPRDRYATTGEFAHALRADGAGEEKLRASVRGWQRWTVAAHRRSLWQVFAAYVVVSWGAYQVIDVLPRVIGLPEWVPTISVALFLVGLPIVLATAFVQGGGSGRTASPDPSTPLASTADAFAKHLRLLTWKRSLLGGLAAFLILAAATAGYLTLRALGIGPWGSLLAAGKLEATDVVVLADFEDTTPERALGASITEAVRIDLSGSGAIRVADPTLVADVLQRMRRTNVNTLHRELAREVAQRENLKVVLAGKVGALGSSYVLTAEIVSAGSGRVLASFRENAWNEDRLLAATEKLVRRIRAKIGESLRSVNSSAPLERVTTASLEALRKYSSAIPYRDGPEGITLLEEAIAVDSTFAMAWRKLGAWQTNAGRRSAAVRAYTAAYRHRDNLTPIERALAEADFYRRVRFDYVRAATAYRSALALDPNDAIALNNATMLHNMTRNFAAAESIGARGLALRQPISAQFATLFEAQFSLGKFADALRTAEAHRLVYPNSINAHRWGATVAMQSGEYERADSIGAALEPRTTTRLGFEIRTQVAGARGQLERAAEHVRRNRARSAELSGVAALPGQDIGLAFLLLAHGVNQKQALALLISSEDSVHNAANELDQPLETLGILFAWAGELGRARHYLARAEARQQVEGASVDTWILPALRARVALLQGRTTDAIPELRRAARVRCDRCILYEMAVAFDRLGQADSAIAYYERFLNTPRYYVFTGLITVVGPSRLRLGELYDARGNREKAAEYYSLILEQWKDADPVLQARLVPVRTRLRQVAQERGQRLK